MVNANRGKGFGRLFRSEKEDNRRLVSSDEDEPAEQFEFEEADEAEPWKAHRSSQSQSQLSTRQARGPSKSLVNNDHDRSSAGSDAVKLPMTEDDGWHVLR
jgi:hypothetical protein